MGSRIESAELGRARWFIRELLAILDRVRLGVSLTAAETETADRARRFVDKRP